MGEEMAMAAHAKMLDAEAERDELRDRLSRVEGALRELHDIIVHREGRGLTYQNAIRRARELLPHPEDTGRPKCGWCDGTGLDPNRTDGRDCPRCQGGTTLAPHGQAGS